MFIVLWERKKCDELMLREQTNLIKFVLTIGIWAILSGIIFYPIQHLILQYTFDWPSHLTINQVAYSIALVIGAVLTGLAMFYMTKLHRILFKKKLVNN